MDGSFNDDPSFSNLFDDAIGDISGVEEMFNNMGKDMSGNLFENMMDADEMKDHLSGIMDGKIGSLAKEIAEEASKIAGGSKVLLCDNPTYEKHMAESYADVVVEISSDYNAILTTASTTGKNFMPRVAALLDVPQISEIINVIDSNTFERPIYAGNAIQTVKSLSDKKIITVRAPSFQAVESQDPATVENIQNSEDKNLSCLLYTSPSPRD